MLPHMYSFIYLCIIFFLANEWIHLLPHFLGTLDKSKGHRFAHSELSQNQVFQALMNELAQKFDSTASRDIKNTPGLQVTHIAALL